MRTNELGQMYALTVMTPVDPSRVDDVEGVLAGLPRRPSPFARMSSVHFARWVMILDFLSDPSQPAPEHLPAPYLLLSATFDGSRDVFLADLASQLPHETEAIYRCCIGAPEPARGAPLEAYLRHNQVETGLFFSEVPDAAEPLRGPAEDSATVSLPADPETSPTDIRPPTSPRRFYAAYPRLRRCQPPVR